MKSIAVDLVQKSELSNKLWFIKLVNDLSQDDFKKFCKEIMHLRQHYDTTVGLHCTCLNRIAIVNDEMFQLQEIDFDTDVNFKKIS